MTKETRSQALRYASAIVSVVSVTLLRMSLDPFPGAVGPFAFYLIAVVFTAWYGRLIPALIATGLGAVAAQYFSVPARGFLSVTEPGGYGELAIYLVTGIAIALLSEASRRNARTETDMDAEAALPEEDSSEDGDRYRILYEDNPAMYFTVDGEGTVLAVNRFGAEQLGYKREELIGQSVLSVVNEEDKERVLQQLAACMRNPAQIAHWEFRKVRKDGSLMWVKEAARAVQGLDGNMVALISCEDITERKLTEEQVEVLARFPAENPNPVLRLNPEGIILNANLSSRPLLAEWGCEEGDTAPELYRETAREVLKRKSKRNLDVECNGRVYSFTVVPVPEANYVNLYGEDITERKLAETEKTRLLNEIESHRQRVNSIVSTVPGVVWEAWGEPDEASQRIDFVSDYVEEMMGYRVEEWLSTPNFWLTIVHPDDKNRTGEEAARYFAAGTGGVSRFRWVTKDGSVLWVEAHSVVISDVEGKPIGMRGVTMDITERKRAEDRQRFLVEASNVLASSLDYEITLQNLTRLATPALADWCAVHMLEPNGQIRQLALAQADPNRAEWTREFERCYPPDTNAPDAALNVMMTGESGFYPDIPDTFLKASAGDSVLARTANALGMKSAMIVPLLARGQPLGAITFISGESRYTAADLSLAEELARRATLAVDNARLYREAQEAVSAREEALKHRDEILVREQSARAEAEAANRAKDEFLATVSHELRTPLNAMLGWASMLRRSNVDRETADRALETIERNAKAQAQIIEDILDVSRIITGRLRLEVRPVDLTSIVETAIESGRPATEAKGIELRASLDPAAGLISGDPDRLQQVVWNLLTNAVKFTPKGGRVEVLLNRVNTHVELKVRDTGQGIGPQFLPYVFDRFRQADSTTRRKYGGLGLGLSIVRHLVEMHGGTVMAESPGEGRGSTFIVRLPLIDERKEPDIEDAARARTVESPFEGTALLEGLRVLIVDDDSDTRQMLGLTLSECSAEVKTCSSTSEALEAIREWKPDILVSDIQMPGEDGYDLMRQVRQLGPELRGEIPAIALTAYARVEDRMRAFSAGYNIHLPKPVEPTELISVIASLAGRSS